MLQNPTDTQKINIPNKSSIRPQLQRCLCCHDNNFQLSDVSHILILEQQAVVFPIAFCKFFWGNKALMKGTSRDGDPQFHLLGKALRWPSNNKVSLYVSCCHGNSISVNKVYCRFLLFKRQIS